jgi:hypothetical protein
MKWLKGRKQQPFIIPQHALNPAASFSGKVKLQLSFGTLDSFKALFQDLFT